VRRQIAPLLQTKAQVSGTSTLYYYHHDKNQAFRYQYRASRPWVSGNTLAYRKELWERRPFEPIQVAEDVKFLAALPADLICDLVSTGSTLQANHLREVETVLESHAVIIRTPVSLPPDKDEWVERLMMRIDGVQQVRESKYIMLHAPRSALAEIRRLLPGSESPTIIPLEGFPDRVAVHAVCRENVFWETLESLKKAGASALLVLPVEKMLA